MVTAVDSRRREGSGGWNVGLCSSDPGEFRSDDEWSMVEGAISAAGRSVDQQGK